MLGLFGKGGFRKYWRDTILLYDDLIFSSRVKNDTYMGRKLPKRSDRIGVDFVATYDGDRVTYYYLVHEYPSELMINFKTRLRAECGEDVRVNFLNHMRGYKLDWDSPLMRSRLRTMKKVGEDNDESDVDAYNLHRSVNALDKQVRVEESLAYLAVADKKRARSMLRTSMLMTISGIKGEEFDTSVERIEGVCKSLGIGVDRVIYDIPLLLEYFSPFSRKESGGGGRVVHTQVLTDEILARMVAYEQGTLGVRGVSFGNDIFTKFPVMKMVKRKEDVAENWLVAGETGSGKSHLLKDIILQLIGLNFNGTIMDVEGFEYIPLANFLSHNSNVVVINVAEGSGRYFDPVEIPRITGIEDIDKDLMKMSVDFTLAKLNTLLGKVCNESIWVDIIINDAVTEVYLRNGITEERETWHLSEGLTLFDVYEMLYILKEEGYRSNEEYQVAGEMVLAVLSKYFDSGGTRSGYFTERVRVSEIMDADLVICSFGMAGKSSQAVDATQLALMQIDAAVLSHQRSIFSKLKGKYNFKLWEEFQRWGKFPDAEKTLGVALTGGRKLGDVNIIITNKLSELLDGDKFGIFDNITSFLIGAIGDSKVREDVCKRLSIEYMLKELDEIALAKKDEDEYKDKGDTGNSKYRYSFLCGLDRSKYGVVKVLLPDELGESSLFKTGVNIVG